MVWCAPKENMKRAHSRGAVLGEKFFWRSHLVKPETDHLCSPCGKEGGVDPDGFVLESCVLNVVLVDEKATLRTPPFERLLKGCTVRKVMALASSKSALGLSGVRQSRVALEECYAAKELLLVAGDTHVFACTSLDGRPIGDGKPGPVSRQLRELLEADAKFGCDEGDHEEL